MKKGMETSFCVSFCALLCLSLFLGCSESNTAGATSETTNFLIQADEFLSTIVSVSVQAEIALWRLLRVKIPHS